MGCRTWDDSKDKVIIKTETIKIRTAKSVRDLDVYKLTFDTSMEIRLKYSGNRVEIH